jgi:hypothetical protein
VRISGCPLTECDTANKCLDIGRCRLAWKDELDFEESTLKKMSASCFMLSDTDYCVEVVCRKAALDRNRKAL